MGEELPHSHERNILSPLGKDFAQVRPNLLCFVIKLPNSFVPENGFELKQMKAQHK